MNATVAAGAADDDDSTRDAVTFRYVKLGYIRSIFLVGASHFSIDYGQYDNSVASGDEGDTYGFQFVQPIPTWGTEFYFGYRNYELARPGASFDNLHAVLAGARVKF